MSTRYSTRYNTVVIGGGRSGLAAAHFLAQTGHTLTVLDDRRRAGDTWRQR